VYEIRNDVTNWHVIGEEVKKQFFDETQRFFNSLKVNAVPKNKSNAASKNSGPQTPAGFLGAVDKTGYKNTFFGFAFSFPPNWYRLTETQIETSRNFGKAVLRTEDERINKAFEESEKKEVVIFAITQKNSEGEAEANFAITVIKQPDSQINAKLVAAVTQKFLLTNPKIKSLKDVEDVEINKTPFSTFTVQTAVNGKVIEQKIHVTMRRGYSLTFVSTYQNSASQKEIEKIMQSLKFDVK
jgi:hypothetical protein